MNQQGLGPMGMFGEVFCSLGRSALEHMARRHFLCDGCVKVKRESDVLVSVVLVSVPLSGCSGFIKQCLIVLPPLAAILTNMCQLPTRCYKPIHLCDDIL